MLPVLLGAAEVLGIAGSARDGWRRHRPFWLLTMLVGAAYVGFRMLVIGPRGVGGFAPYGPFVVLEVGWLDRVMTMLGVAPHWFRLLLFPVRLSSEYGPPAYPVLTAPSITMVPGILMLIGVGGLAIALRRRRPVFTFGLAWCAITLLPSSNFVLPAGILLAERTLFTPSIGAMIAIGSWLPVVYRALRSTIGRIAGLVLLQGTLVAGIVLSLVQSTVWRSNTTLFDAAVVREPMVYRAHYMRGAWLMARGENEEGYREFLIAMAQFPHDPGVPYNLGHQLFLLGNFRQAYQMYRRADAIYPGYLDAPSRMALMLAAAGDLPAARDAAMKALEGDDEMVPAMRAVLRAAALQDGGPMRLIPRPAAVGSMPR